MVMDIDMEPKQYSPIHKASLVDASLHSPALLELLDIKLTRPVIEYVVDNIVETVDYAMGRPSSSSSSSRGRSAARNPKHAAFTTFVTNVLTRAEVTIPVILASLVYVHRAKPHLHIALEEWACERVFLGAVMLASKYLNDSTLKNVHWALCTGVFGKRDVGRIERELLDVLDFELGILEDDILSHHDGLSAVTLHNHSHRSHVHVSAAAPRRHHRSSHYAPSVPALEHSESSSSSGSASPETPSSTAYSPESINNKSQSKSISPSSTMELLRSFPIPVPSNAPSKHYSSFSLHGTRFTPMRAGITA